ncbi:tRNA1(Val) (adenine(37)-N6)-methyltransferase [Peptoniphilus stercorisuis]|uniref:tRNA1(Val) A37 N6-methylase TrmN6 n=1 Tax=Peptoniphilus stercorisuis TaxID=1436965 RepID=A0ABS4KA97_9FIRM|nr:methyltransferase [Peptoniphilus stercorisuis]MBP2024689.1 tRNA1(Val) A37 N6-methylase TrmN6 [Peptoniphilus stercorisuis]
MKKDIVPGTDYVIFQDDNVFKYTTDSLLLTSLARPNGRVCDIGSGSGIISLRLIDNKNIKTFTNIELNYDSYEISKKSIRENQLEDKINSLNINVFDVKKHFDNQSFDTVIMNPPYFSKSLKNYKKSKEIARHSDSIEGFIQAAKYLLKNSGKLFLIFPTKRLVDLIFILRSEGLEPKKLRFIKNDKDKESYLVFVEAVKEGKCEIKILPDLILYEDKKRSSELEKVYENKEI